MREDEDDLYDGDTPGNVFSDPAVRLVERDPVSHRVGVVQSSVLYTFYRQHPMAIIVDTGATTNMIRASTARVYMLPITPASQIARQADGVTPLNVIGYIHCNVTRGSLSFQLDALVVKQLDVDVLAGNPFRARNDVAVRPTKKQIIIGDADMIYYGTGESKADVPSVRRTQAFLLIIWSYTHLVTDTLRALESRLDSRTNMHSKPERAWSPPQEILSVSGALIVANDTDAPILVNWGEHICHARQITSVSPADDPDVCSGRVRLCSESYTSHSTVQRRFYKEQRDCNTLYVRRSDKAGVFNAILRKHQVTWLPCEVAALSIGAAIKHFAPFIIQSSHATEILTDNRPCVEAYEKLMRDEFTLQLERHNSSLNCRYRVHIRHIDGVANLPSDFGSRNPQATSVACHQCQAVKSIPVYLRPQSFTQAPTVVGSSFAADVTRRYRQYIIVLRETLSSYTLPSLIDGERHDQLRNALLSMCAELRLLGDNPITVRVDPAPGFVALVNDSD
ncbi:hypothetical protein NP493_300g00016 [Ridgeia piscesae]|uniref:Uncharacterized protein n=1 Tax=Ridgeia piscesae TaxID=27915 RepID=A0AAD9NV80_RIDPI|nr:hypothetical protein NP493_300g00016 [Ridgeia piscesae]